ncbi:arrestin (or S-antigen), N-terminal domain protein [Aspergillus chevalieri]|uniref:Bul1 C-terminal domain-containing protein n=1 Tax=Aspergillus chevalieri TaxID=182096 RepID=A0A7R7VDD4_ASPCH|nr:uncharacterized protein ACHE_10139S [Aspergillus chevalieri]BCR82737.1 hypothetical protein ACHE_10139S [Aspergillus chevalieri]
MVNLDLRRRPKIQIALKNQQPNLVNTYTTGDRIDGAATITVDHDIPFDNLDITFEGTSRTTVERASVPGQSGAHQTFLKLRQPIDHYPSPRILQPGHTYVFPFTFVVPDRLLPQACNHPKDHGHLEHAHTLLPPTLGDTMVTLRNGKSALVDDLCPEMCRVAYFIRTAVLKKDGSGKRKVLGSGTQKVRITPVVEEQPPLNIPDHEVDGYCVRKEKDLRRGWTRAKRGRLVVSTAQPKPLVSNHGGEESVNSVATLDLRFEPVTEDEAPPQLGTVWTKVTASTFYGAQPWRDFPAGIRASSWAQLGRGVYIESVPLSTRCVASASWTKHSRRDSFSSSSSTSSASTASTSASSTTGSYYTASVIIPITPPTSKTLVPTFHSCLLSRTYSLDLSISYHAPHTSRLLGSAVSLKVPIQVTCSPQNIPAKNAAEVVNVSEMDVDVEAFFTPRDVTGLAVAPPAYGDYRPRVVGAGTEESQRRSVCV